MAIVATDAGTTARDAVGAACGGGSFTPTTEVVMAGGRTLPLDQIKPGDKVEATDTTTGKTTAQTVTKVWVNHDTDLMNVTVTAGGKTSVIQATQHHLFWDATRKAWVEADDLAAGDQLRTDDGRLANVAGTVVVAGASDMWDLTVANDHDFYVVTTVANVLVHNCSISTHAAQQMEARGVSQAQLDSTLQRSPFSYWHEGQWKSGYYDPKTGIFVGKTIDGTVNTVMTNVTKPYIQRLMAAQP